MKEIPGPKQTGLFAIPHIKILCVSEAEVMDRRCDSPEVVFRIWQETVVKEPSYDPEKEVFVLFILNRKNHLKSFNIVTVGTLSASLVHPREVFRPAIAQAASAIVVAHNHPSGDPAPSSADIQVTRQLREAGRTLGIDLLDHVIIGQAGCDPRGTGHYSFRDAGLI
jgi:DNA repair protein RadC